MDGGFGSAKLVKLFASTLLKVNADTRYTRLHLCALDTPTRIHPNAPIAVALGALSRPSHTFLTKPLGALSLWRYDKIIPCQ